MAATATYTYVMAPQTRDEFGLLRDRCTIEISESEFAELEVGEFESAMDLPDGTEYARGVDVDGNQIKVYRTVAA